MLKKTKYLKSAVGLFAAVGMIQAAPVTLTQLYNYQGNMSWQDIQSISASFADDNRNNILEIGEAVTFSVTMEKANWGSHDFDALKIWIDKLPGIESPYFATQTFEWDFNGDIPNGSNDWYYKDLDWTGGTKTFSKTVTFSEAGEWGFEASVMCSRDLAALTGGYTWDERGLTQADWDAWSPANHKPVNGVRSTRQGEDEAYKLTVYTRNVPEPGILGLVGFGILSLAFIRRKK